MGQDDTAGLAAGGEYFDVPDTSALVLGLCDPEAAYPTENAKAYMQCLDLSKGRALANSINTAAAGSQSDLDQSARVQLKVQRYLRDQVKFRKYRMREILMEQVENGVTQLVSVGAGVAPTELDFVSQNENCVAVGVDYSEQLLLTKKKIVEKACPSALPKLDFVTADVRDVDALFRLLKDSELWDESKPTVWLLEGLVYYITEDETVALMKAILDRGDVIIVDWARPEERVVEHDRVAVAVGCQAIAKGVGREAHEIQRMNLDRVVQRIGAEVKLHETSYDIEQRRLHRGLDSIQTYADALEGALAIAFLGAPSRPAE